MRKSLTINQNNIVNGNRMITDLSISCNNDSREIDFDFESIDFSDDDHAEVPTGTMPKSFSLDKDAFKSVISTLEDVDAARFNGFAVSTELKFHLGGKMGKMNTYMNTDSNIVIRIHIFGDKTYFIYMNRTFPNSNLGQIIGLLKLCKDVMDA